MSPIREYAYHIALIFPIRYHSLSIYVATSKYYPNYIPVSYSWAVNTMQILNIDLLLTRQSQHRHEYTRLIGLGVAK